MNRRLYTDEELFWRAFEGQMHATFWRLAACPICNSDSEMRRAMKAKQRALKAKRPTMFDRR